MSGFGGEESVTSGAWSVSLDANDVSLAQARGHCGHSGPAWNFASDPESESAVHDNLQVTGVHPCGVTRQGSHGFRMSGSGRRRLASAIRRSFFVLRQSSWGTMGYQG